MEDLGWILLLPLLGTAAGAAAVFFTPRRCRGAMDGLSGFAAGVMTAASVWSLILPAVELAAGWGRFSFFPAATGILLGFGLLPVLDRFLPEGTRLTAAAVTLHNLPEGMAVGVAAAGCLAGSVSPAAVFALSLGIALQNLPEGTIIALPLRAAGSSRRRAFTLGVLSGVIEPVGAVLSMWLAAPAGWALPWMLGFSAGAMLCASAELTGELRTRRAKECYGLGFALMMALDVALG